jgi:acyl carrier protein
MTRAEFLRALETSLEIDQGKLAGNQRLEDLEFWDSMSALIYMGLADEKLHVTVSGDQIVKCKTVDDLLGLLAGGLTG